MKKKISMVTVLVVSLIASLMFSFASTSITDIEGHWASEVIERRVADGLVKGYPDGTFRPNSEITRSEFIVLINRFFGFEESKANTFVDVNESDWFYEEIGIALHEGYILGYADGTFAPNNLISRQEVAVILSRITNAEVVQDKSLIYQDEKDIQSWSIDAVRSVNQLGLMTGYPDGTFRPSNFITRSEALYAVHQAIEAGASKVPYTIIAKQDFFGITYIHVILDEKREASKVTANGMPLTYDSEDGRWKGKSLTMAIGDEIHIEVISGGNIYKKSQEIEEL